jgi:hypothetical protein
MKNIIKYLWFKIQLVIGIKNFYKNGITSKIAYYAFRQMFVLTGGISNDNLTKEIKKRNGKVTTKNISGILSSLTINDFNYKLNEMENNGYVIFDNKLDDDTISKLTQLALQTPSLYIDIETNDFSSESVIFNPEKPLSPRYQFENNKIINNDNVQKLVFDQSLLYFAQEYLGSKPILDLVAFWWSLPFGGKGKSAAAQLYHFDMDRIKFIKFFFYLTDVNPDTGPHCYVKGSHKVLPKILRRDGRFSDQEIRDCYGSDNLIEICGKKGTIMAVDTRGFHKGKELLINNRLLLQIEFANSMFGQLYPKIDIEYFNDDIKKISKENRFTYGEIFN